MFYLITCKGKKIYGFYTYVENLSMSKKKNFSDFYFKDAKNVLTDIETGDQLTEIKIPKGTFLTFKNGWYCSNCIIFGKQYSLSKPEAYEILVTNKLDLHLYYYKIWNNATVKKYPEITSYLKNVNSTANPQKFNFSNAFSLALQAFEPETLQNKKCKNIHSPSLAVNYTLQTLSQLKQRYAQIATRYMYQSLKSRSVELTRILVNFGANIHNCEPEKFLRKAIIRNDNETIKLIVELAGTVYIEKILIEESQLSDSKALQTIAKIESKEIDQYLISFSTVNKNIFKQIVKLSDVHKESSIVNLLFR